MRIDLNRWQESEYPATTFMSLRAALGARRYRCEYCRNNFVSFRPRRERFSFQRWKNRKKTVCAG